MSRQIGSKGAAILWFMGVAAATLSLLRAISALAVEAPVGQATSIACAVVQDLGGEVEFLDASRNAILDTGKRGFIPCGSWISTHSGWVHLRHREGFVINVGSNTFLQLDESNAGRLATDPGSPITLYRGQLVGSAEDGAPELRITTANGLVKVNNGKTLVLFDENEQETEVVGIERSATFENRFQPAAKVKVAQGEASILDFQKLRVTPQPPKAIALAALRSRLAGFHLDEKERSKALRTAQRRIERKSGELPAGFRVPASVGDDSGRAGTEEEQARKAAEEPAGASPIAAAKHRKSSRAPAHQAYRVSGKISVASNGQAEERKKDEAEERKLIQELSKIRSD